MPGAEAIVPPVFLWDPRQGRLLAFASAAAAAGHLRAWQEVGAVVAYDAEGRDLRFGVERRRRRLLGLIPFERELVVVNAAEREPSHAEALRAALVVSLAGEGAPRAALAGLPLEDLVQRAAAGAGVVTSAPTRAP
jgi:hypothetical protein